MQRVNISFKFLSVDCGNCINERRMTKSTAVLIVSRIDSLNKEVFEELGWSIPRCSFSKRLALVLDAGLIHLRPHRDRIVKLLGLLWQL